MEQSYINQGQNGTVSFVGADATALFAAMVLVRAIRMYVSHGIKASRNYTPANMLAAASRITHKQYKRGQLAMAADDVQKWADTMKAALPVTKGE